MGKGKAVARMIARINMIFRSCIIFSALAAPRCPRVEDGFDQVSQPLQGIGLFVIVGMPVIGAKEQEARINAEEAARLADPP